MNRNFTDYHCHLLPALDDGSTDLDQSLKMARILSVFGFTSVHCTSHRITGCYDNAPETIVSATFSLQRLLNAEGIGLRLVPGTEHYLDEFLPELLPGAGTVATSRYLLVEVPFRCGSEILPATVSTIFESGLTPLFAHPERCAVFEPGVKEQKPRGALSFLQKSRNVLDMEGSLICTLMHSGCRFQGNLGSFAGAYGAEVKQRAILFLKNGIYSCLGSDAHRSERLAATLAAGWQTVTEAVGEETACRLLTGDALQSTKVV